MREIVHYAGEFRREEATSAVGSHAKQAVRVDDPTPMLDRPGGIWACMQKIVPSVTGLRFSEP